MDFELSALIRAIRGELFGGYGKAHSSGFRPCLSFEGSIRQAFFARKLSFGCTVLEEPCS
jgi:hypothetical protein